MKDMIYICIVYVLQIHQSAYMKLVKVWNLDSECVQNTCNNYKP